MVNSFFTRGAAWVPALIWMGVIYAFSGCSEPYPGEVPGWAGDWLDPAMHVLEYGGLTFAYYFGLTGGKLFQSPPPGKFLITASLMAVGFGVTDEIHQFFVPGRSFQVSDLLMDAAGAGFATLTLRVGASRCSGNGQGGDLHV